MRKETLALLTLLCFGCATVREPVSAPAGEFPAAQGNILEPQVELWMESGEAVTPAEKAQAWSAAHEALWQALAHRQIAANALGASDAVLVVRERAVARTASRRRDQKAAIVGMVVGIVVVVAVVAVLLVSSRGSSKSAPAAAKASNAPGAAKATAPAPHAAAAPVLARPPAPHAGPVAPRAPVVPRIAVAAPLPHFYSYAPAPRFYYDPWLDLGFDLWVEPRPLVIAPPDDELGPGEARPAESPEARALEESAPPPPADAQLQPEAQAAPEPQALQPAQPPPLQLPPEPDYPLADRGFFAGDDTLLDVNLLDRATGQLLWSKTVQDGCDPRDVHDVARLLDDALTGQQWASASR